jgi:hypothetical protein
MVKFFEYNNGKVRLRGAAGSGGANRASYSTVLSALVEVTCYVVAQLATSSVKIG